MSFVKVGDGQIVTVIEGEDDRIGSDEKARTALDKATKAVKEAEMVEDQVIKTNLD